MDFDGLVTYQPSFLTQEESSELLSSGLNQVTWSRPKLTVFGKTHRTPRYCAWLSDAPVVYRYSGYEHQPDPFPDSVRELKDRIEHHTGHSFNATLVNRYDNGSHCMGWHSDNETELGDEVTIASISIGARRTFQLRHKTHKDRKISVELDHGSLLMMYPPSQQYWQHQLPKRADIQEVRVNFTFRWVNEPRR